MILASTITYGWCFLGQKKSYSRGSPLLYSEFCLLGDNDSFKQMIDDTLSVGDAIASSYVSFLLTFLSKKKVAISSLQESME